MNRTYLNQTVMATTSPSILPNADHGLVLSYPTFFPGLDLNYAITSAIISVASGVIVLGFLWGRISQWLTLRRPLPVATDNLGNEVPRRGELSTVAMWPSVLLSKISLRSFGPPGVPSLGTILLIVLWVGVNALASFLFLLPNLSVEGIAYRLP